MSSAGPWCRERVWSRDIVDAFQTLTYQKVIYTSMIEYSRKPFSDRSVVRERKRDTHRVVFLHSKGSENATAVVAWSLEQSRAREKSVRGPTHKLVDGAAGEGLVSWHITQLTQLGGKETLIYHQSIYLKIFCQFSLSDFWKQYFTTQK